jgi:16S rRNA (guanine(966)-N(2))-methyltransferase RsmD
MRIIGGKFKSKRFKAPGKIKARPTTDFAKEGLFNILSNDFYFEDLRVLDLFAGIGGISLEFASRGVPETTTIDIERKHIKFIDSMITDLGLENEIHTILADVFKYFNTCKKTYNLIFADPPYKLEKALKIPSIIFDKGILEKGGTLIMEHDKFSDYSDQKHYVNTRNYGNVNFSFFVFE